MRVTSTEFRADLFQIVERALQGELVEFAHDGRVVRLVPLERTSNQILKFGPRGRKSAAPEPDFRDSDARVRDALRKGRNQVRSGA